jgi:hypothetical protein
MADLTAEGLFELASAFEMEMDLAGEFGDSIGEDIQVTADGSISDALARLQHVEGVTSVVVMSAGGEIVKTTLAHEEASRRGLAALELQLRAQDAIDFSTAATGRAARSELLTSIQIKSRKEEFVLSCDEHFVMLVGQKQQAAA